MRAGAGRVVVAEQGLRGLPECALWCALGRGARAALGGFALIKVQDGGCGAAGELVAGGCAHRVTKRGDGGGLGLGTVHACLECEQ